MLFRLHRPRGPLARFVETITYFEGYDPDHTKEKLLPDGGIDLIVDLGETPKRLFDRDDHARFRSFRKAWISGMRREWIVIEAAPQSSMAVIRFRPAGAYPFLGFPAAELTDVVEELDQVIGARAVSLRDRVLAAATPEARVAAIEGFLLELAGGRSAANPAVDFLVERLMEPGALRISDLVGEVGFSQKHTIALFKRWVGLTPKQFCRIRRLQTVVSLLASRNGSGVDWAEVAQRAGYYDQAHFINEFRRFTGMTPGGYLAAPVEYIALDGPGREPPPPGPR